MLSDKWSKEQYFSLNCSEAEVFILSSEPQKCIQVENLSFITTKVEHLEGCRLVGLLPVRDLLKPNAGQN